ncbi:hypothetical protein JXO52_05010 [bacterium]|nr:hypothetical protein [bacterium]
MNEAEVKKLNVLTPLLGVLLAVVSYCGSFLPATYARETASMAAQGIGQDLFNLFIVVPLLIGSFALLRKNSLAARSLYAGTLLYILYSFVIYSFGVHFNALFLGYCAVLGLSFYMFIITISAVIRDSGQRVETGMPAKGTGIFFIGVAVIFYLLWLKDVVPPLLRGEVPQSVSDYDLLVNPVHVLDMAIMLPALLIVALSLLKRTQLGLSCAPVLLVFIVLLTLALAAMVLMLYLREISEDLTVMIVFLVMALFSMVFLVRFFRKR